MIHSRLAASPLLLVIVALCAACRGSSPTSPGAPSLQALLGSWSGLVSVPECASLPNACPNPPIQRFRVTFAEIDGQRVLGQMFLGVYTLDVAGVRGDDGLQLTGSGTAAYGVGGYPIQIVGTLSVLNGVALTGKIAARITYAGEPAYIPLHTPTFVLEHTFKTGTPESAQLLPPDRRASIHVDRVLVQRRQAVPGTPARMSYTGCHSLRSYSSMQGTVYWTLTPLGPDGAEYPVTQLLIPPARSLTSTGCGSPESFDLDLNRPIAPRARINVEIVFDDGAKTGWQGVLPVTGQ